jgi:hypothetical protein
MDPLIEKLALQSGDVVIIRVEGSAPDQALIANLRAAMPPGVHAWILPMSASASTLERIPPEERRQLAAAITESLRARERPRKVVERRTPPAASVPAGQLRQKPVSSPRVYPPGRPDFAAPRGRR